MEQENLYKFYTELVDENKWKTKNFKMSLAKGMLMIESNDYKIRLVLDVRKEKTTPSKVVITK